MNPETIPSITVQELAERMQHNPDLIILDVREPVELAAARIPDGRVAHAPLSVLATSRTPLLPQQAQDQEAEIAVLCHLGERSAQVTRWLRRMGWKNVYNVLGGIEAYARDVDPEVGFY